MFCNHCGTELPEGSLACAKCGTSFVAPTQPVQQTHDVPKCTCCGHVGEMKPGPLIRGSDWIWFFLLLFFAGAGFIYLLFVIIIRSNKKKREQICPNCKSVNMFTYVY